MGFEAYKEHKWFINQILDDHPVPKDHNAAVINITLCLASVQELESFEPKGFPTGAGITDLDRQLCFFFSFQFCPRCLDFTAEHVWILFISPVYLHHGETASYCGGIHAYKHEGLVWSLCQTHMDPIGYIATLALLPCGCPGWVRSKTTKRGNIHSERKSWFSLICIISNRLTAALEVVLYALLSCVDFNILSSHCTTSSPFALNFCTKQHQFPAISFKPFI